MCAPSLWSRLSLGLVRAGVGRHGRASGCLRRRRFVDAATAAKVCFEISNLLAVESTEGVERLERCGASVVATPGVLIAGKPDDRIRGRFVDVAAAAKIGLEISHLFAGEGTEGI